MTAGSIAALYAVWAIAVVSPGPDLVVVVQRALAGRRHGLATAVGVVAGITVWIVAAFAGLAALLRVQPGLMSGLQIAGGLLLAALGVLGVRGWWRSRGAAEPPTPEPGPAPGHAPSPAPGPAPGSASAPAPGHTPPSRSTTLRRDALRGLATNLSNPKAVVFFGAVLTPFLTGELGVGLGAALVAGMVAIALVWFCALALAASLPGVQRRIGRWLPWVDLAVSALFVVVGVTFVVAALSSVADG